MKKLGFTSVAMAVSALIATPAFAVTNLATGANLQRYASELNPTAAAPILLTATGANDLNANVALGWGFSNAVPFYVRFDVSGADFNGTITSNALSITGGTVTVSQSGTNYVIFSVNPTSSLLQSSNVIFGVSAAGAGGFTGYRVNSKSGATLRYRVYDDAIAAANGGAALADSTAKSFIDFSSAAYSSQSTSRTSTANVLASPAYSSFVSAAPTNSTSVIQLGTITSAIDANVTDATSAFTTAAFNNAQVVITATEGDFSWTNTSATNSVFLSLNASCDFSDSANRIVAATRTSTVATFNGVAAANFGNGSVLYACATARSGATIGKSTFSLSSTIPPANASYGSFASPSRTVFGQVVQNGTTIWLPLVQVAPGYVTRLVLTNVTDPTSGTDASYTMTGFGETGRTVTLTGAAASGSVPKGVATVVDLTTANMTVAGSGSGQRGAIRVTITAPGSNIRALYQTVSPSGGISNQSLTIE